MANKVIDPAPIIKKLADRCLVAKGRECSILGELIDALRAAPAVDAVEVVHGRWDKVKQDLGDGIKTYRFGCSECGYLKNTLTGNYCPNCGAKMDGDGNG